LLKSFGMLIIILLLVIALVFISARYLFSKARIYLPVTAYRILMGIHLFLLLMAISTFILSSYNIYWRGYRSTSFIIIATAITGLLCVWLYKGKPFFVFIILVFIQTLFATVVVLDMTDNYKSGLYYNDNKYRLEYSSHFISKFVSLPNLFIKNGFFERRIVLGDKYTPPGFDLYVGTIKNVTIKKQTEQQISITFTYAADTAIVKKNTLTIEVDLNK
jgi:hypothetical protein